MFRAFIGLQPVIVISGAPAWSTREYMRRHAQCARLRVQPDLGRDSRLARQQ